MSIIAEFDYPFVTCGSVLKLLNLRNNVRLHSHDVKYGSGSGQQVSIETDYYPIYTCTLAMTERRSVYTGRALPSPNWSTSRRLSR